MSMESQEELLGDVIESRAFEPLTVLFVITGLGMGGAERVVVDLAERLHARGHRPVIAYLRGEAIVRPQVADIPVIPIGLEQPRHLFGALLRLRALVKALRPDVVHSHLVHANLLIRLMRIFTPMRVLVTTAHNTDEESKIRMWAYRCTNRLADLSTNVSAEAVAAFERDGAMPKGLMQVVHNGIDTRRFAPDPGRRQQLRAQLGAGDGCKLLLVVGRLEPQKDHQNLLNALALLHAERRDWVCLMAGDGALRPELERQIRESGLDGHVRLLGVRRDIPDLLAAADYLVLSSAWEGFPLVVGEAMACACPVVATNCGGVAEFLGANDRLLVSPRDSAALSAALRAALDTSEEERMRMGQNCRQRVVDLFSLDSAVERWLEIYRAQLLGKDGVHPQCAE